MNPAPRQCQKCGEWRQNLPAHDASMHPVGARVLPTVPMSHMPMDEEGNWTPNCKCKFPLIHHFHGYERDCPCPDCRPSDGRPSSVLNRIGRTVRTALGRRTIR